MIYVLFEVGSFCLDGVFQVLPTLYIGVWKISFVSHVNELLIKYSIPLALLAAVRTFADGVNAEFTVIPRLLICSHYVICSPFTSSKTTRRCSGWPPIDRWWFLWMTYGCWFLRMTYGWWRLRMMTYGKSHLRDQVSACSIDDLMSGCWLLGAMSFTSSAKNKWLQVNSSTQLVILRGIPIATISLTSRRWHTGSKAFEKSKYTTFLDTQTKKMLCVWQDFRISKTREFVMNHVDLQTAPRHAWVLLIHDGMVDVYPSTKLSVIF